VFPPFLFGGNTMTIEQHLCLNGSGYLHEVVQEKGTTIARINIVTHFGLRTSLQDNIWMDCLIQDKILQSHFCSFTQFLQNGHAVLIRFKAEYSKFVTAHSGLSSEDPENIVHLKGRLLTLESSYLDGKKVFSATKTAWQRYLGFAIRTIARAA
jgi:hypothetical protein